MRCIYCQSDTSVIDTRMTKDGNRQRHRKCKVCGEQFSTLEIEIEVTELAGLLHLRDFVQSLADIVRDIRKEAKAVTE